MALRPRRALLDVLVRRHQRELPARRAGGRRRGPVTFTSIFPACYPGRWPHIHFEVYPSLASATSAGNKIATSQIALPKEACDAVYATDGYSASIGAMSRLSIETDNVFRDGYADQVGTVTGSVGSGLTVALSVPVR